MTDARALQAYAERALPQWPAAVVGPVARITDGWESELYTFDLAYGPAGARQQVALVLRLYPGQGVARKAEHEFNGMRRLRQLGYPVPAVHHLALAGSPLGAPFILMDRIDGGPMWPAMAALPPAMQQARLDQFCDLFAQLHALDWRPFVIDPAALATAGPYALVDQALRDARWGVEHLGLPGFGPLVDWLAAHRDVAPCARPAVVHRDFHPGNVLLRADGSAVVIDWSGLGVTDPRFDLAWTVVLVQSHVGDAMRRVILRGYERASGAPVAGLDYFEVFACARRLADVSVSLTQGAARMGMRPEAVALMRAQLPAIAAVARRLEALTGLRLPEVAALLEG